MMLPDQPISFTRSGSGLSRPECIVAEADGTLWVADSRGGVMRISASGEQRFVGGVGGLPNGIAMDRDGSLLVADVDSGRLFRVQRDGRSEIVLDSIEGRPLGALNFVLVDSLGRYWLTVSTLMVPLRPAAFEPAYDGHIILIDARGPRIVADGLCFPNEVRLDAAGAHLYVSETAKRRILRFDVGSGGALTNPVTFGPEHLGGRPDGIAFDERGSLWVTDFDQRRLLVIDQAGACVEIYRDPTGGTISNPTSITFAGPDLKTVYLGSLNLAWLPSFRSRIAGAPMAHWNASRQDLAP
jgi:sugar lactone lactonase YvrE